MYPTARKVTDLDMLESRGFTPFQLDLTSSASIEATVDQLLFTNKGEVGAVVNNAGFGMPGAIQDLTRDAMRHQFEVNLFGLQELTNKLIPVFRKQGYGRIVNISSVVGRLSLPFSSAPDSSPIASLMLTSGVWKWPGAWPPFPVSLLCPARRSSKTSMPSAP